MDFSPVFTSACPLSRNINLSKIKHFQNTVVVRKNGFAFCNLTKLLIKIFYGISCINQRSNRLRILEICRWFRPVCRPRNRNLRVFSIPLFAELFKFINGSFFINCTVNPLRICHKWFNILVRNILGTIANLIIHCWISVLGNTALIASGNPIRPSTQVIKISSTPLFFSPFKIDNQYFALSFSPTYIPRTSFLPSILIPIAIYTAFFQFDFVKIKCIILE